ncbi:MAG: hypothetical protein LBI02_05555, partial [Opitutaceae bacterium]|nr:hypothetical protein [Opitutaceae bacterium]
MGLWQKGKKEERERIKRKEWPVYRVADSLILKSPPNLSLLPQVFSASRQAFENVRQAAAPRRSGAFDAPDAGTLPPESPL